MEDAGKCGERENIAETAVQSSGSQPSDLAQLAHLNAGCHQSNQITYSKKLQYFARAAAAAARKEHLEGASHLTAAGPWGLSLTHGGCLSQAHIRSPGLDIVCVDCVPRSHEVVPQDH